jgi:putative FmdB family regulatory protein
MPVYEYACRTCDIRFEARRSMAEASSPIECPHGHGDTTRLLSVFASVGRSTPAAGRDTSGPPVGGCGAGCACAS